MSLIEVSQLLGNFGEFLGAIAVVVTLIYLAAQVKHNTRAARAATVQSTLTSELYTTATLAEHSSTWDKVVTGAPLASGEEKRRGIILFNLIMIESENRYIQFNSGYLEAQSWEGRLSSLSPLVGLPIFEAWRNTPGAMNHSADFLELLDSLAERVSDE